MKTILIADEDQSTRNIVRYTFELKGYKVLGASSGTDVILKVREIIPDIVLLDTSLSDKSGYEISKEIKNDPLLKSIPVILLAPLFTTFNETELADACPDALILKPFEFDEIIKKVESLTSQKGERALLPAISKAEAHRIKKIKSLSLSIPMGINTSSVNELETLPGIGTKLAQRIVEWRDLNKGFKSIEELEKVKGLSRKKIEAIRPFIRAERQRNYLAVMAVVMLLSLPSILVLFWPAEDVTTPGLATATTTADSRYVRLTHKLQDMKQRWFKIKPLPADAVENGILVIVNDRKEIFISDKKYTPRELRFEIDKSINTEHKKEKKKVILKADATLPYGAVMEIADEIKAMGVKNLEFVAERTPIPHLSNLEKFKRTEQ